MLEINEPQPFRPFRLFRELLLQILQSLHHVCIATAFLPFQQHNGAEERTGIARLFGAGQAAVKNAADAVEELAQIKKMGFKGVMMSGQPGEKDYDDPSYDRLWAAAVDMELPLCFHILTNRAYGGHRGPKINALLNVVRSCQDILGMLIYSGVFDRYPDLKVVCVESDAGWAPHYAYRMDHIYKRHRFGTRRRS